MGKISLSSRDKIFKIINSLLLGLVVISILVPMMYILAASFMNPTVLINEGLSFNPEHWTFEGYERVLADSTILRGFINSFIYSLGFGLMNVFVITTAAYSMSRDELIFN